MKGYVKPEFKWIDHLKMSILSLITHCSIYVD